MNWSTFAFLIVVSMLFAVANLSAEKRVNPDQPAVCCFVPLSGGAPADIPGDGER